MTDEKELIEPSEGEKRNGWTAEALTRFVAESNKIVQNIIDPASAGRRRRPGQCDSPMTSSQWRVR